MTSATESIICVYESRYKMINLIDNEPPVSVRYYIISLFDAVQTVQMNFYN